MSIPIGITTMVDLDLPLPALLERIAAAGFNEVGLSHDVAHSGYQLPEGRRQLARWLADNGLKLDYIHPPITPYIDLCSLDAGVREYSVALHRFIIEACAELGGQALTVHANNDRSIPEEQDAARVAAGLDSLQQLGQLGARLGVLVCVENQPDYLDSQRLTAQLFDGLAGLPGVALTLDPNHARINKPGYLELVAAMAPRVRATHMSDTDGVHDSHLIPGAGLVEWDKLAALLGRAGYGKPSAGAPGDVPAGRQCVVNLEASLWVMRQRIRRGEAQPGDPALADLPSIEDYLAHCASAARKIALDIEAAWVL